MEEPREDGLDGSSIKPVSSLRSHFEQMGVGKPGKMPPPRPISPKPVINMVGSSNGDVFRGVQGQHESMLAPTGGLHPERGREREVGENTGLQNLRAHDLADFSPSPTRNPRPRPPPASQSPLPAVNVLPPQSPPKPRVPHLSLANASAYLSTDGPPSSTGNNSPRNFKIPSRPQTPMIDDSKAPKLSPSRPPSPPPPRRSGELRRDPSVTSRHPPPVNRSEKPKIASKPIALSVTESTTLAPRTPQSVSKQTSPFNTPPNNSPEREVSPPALPGPRPRVVLESTAVNLPGHKTFEPPPLHHSLVHKRLETNTIGRGPLVPQVTGDERPALPNRLSVAFDPPKLRTASTTLMPPPPRPADTKKPAANFAAPIDTSFATPPKRVFSTPTTQSQTPPRTHGRSMTVDRTSNRTPVEFRAPVTVIPKVEPRVSVDIVPTASVKEPLHQNLGDYPDASNINRRPPCFKKGVRDISAKYDTRIMDVCGEFVCTSGLMTRVWSLATGETIMSIVHTEGVKIMSVAFKPAAIVEDEGKRLWLGNNVGELIEVDVATSSLVTCKAGAHTRREIIKIYRHLNEMWTLDDGGTLHLWAPNTAGEPTLSNPQQSFRIPKGHTFSMVVVDELWHATGKELRVFVPTVDMATQFQVLARPLTQPNTGDITAGTVIKSQPENVYFGHADGKVSIYSRRDYSCLGVVNISVYKVTSLAGVDGRLWAGFSTGMVYVYNVESSPWAVKKEWQAHHNGLVVKMIADSSSCWSLDREQVVSLGIDNVLRVWDGGMQEDWIENQMQAEEQNYCELKPIKALVMTWNAGASTPYHLQHSPENQNFFRDLLQSSDGPDILVFGFQELVDLEDKKTTAKSFFKSKKKDDSDQQHMSHQYRDWRDFLTRCLDDFMPRNELYNLLHTASMVGLFTCIFVRAPLRDRIRGISAAEVKRGMGGLHGNKGGLVLRFALDDTSLCFINCHLAAGLSQTKDRNADITAILETPLFPTERDLNARQDLFVSGGDGSLIMDHEICILNGDLNYRIDTMGRDTVVNAVKANNLSKLLERDQLLASKRKNPWFKLRAFQEMPITFAPTYKYDVGTDNYDSSEKKRAPAWCDRLLYRGQSRIRQLTYRRHEVRVSDHRPVTGTFEIIIKSISPKKRAMKWEECQARLSELRARQGDNARLEYLMNVLGFSHAECMKMMAERKARSR